MAEERFPIQEGPSVPWEFMAPHESQCQKNHGQSLKRIAERGGLGASEAWAVVNGIRYYEIKDEHAQKWFELAERVNREWSARQARVEVLAACLAEINKITSIYSNSRHLESKPLIASVCSVIRSRVQNLQPAAKALEELLREAELNLRESLRWHIIHNHHAEAPCQTKCHNFVNAERIAELEKARALWRKNG